MPNVTIAIEESSHYISYIVAVLSESYHGLNLNHAISLLIEANKELQEQKKIIQQDAAREK